MSRPKPRCSEANAAEASGSSTLSEMAEAVICIFRTLYRVASERTGGGDPARTLALLWRDQRRAAGARAPRLDIDEVVAAAVALADERGSTR